MAWVNPEIMVESNTDAIITPMFVEGANGVNVAEGSKHAVHLRGRGGQLGTVPVRRAR